MYKKAKIDRYNYIWRDDLFNNRELSKESCYYILCGALKWWADKDSITYLDNDVLVESYGFVKNTFSQVLLNNGFFIDFEKQRDDIDNIIDMFYFIISTLITYKKKDTILLVIPQFEYYAGIFKKNNEPGFKNILNKEYTNFKDYSINNTLNNSFYSLNIYINYFIDSIPKRVICV
jgi:hypothetical protein